MTALKTKYTTVSQWMPKHHIRGIYLMIVLYVIVVAMLNSSFLTVGNWVNLLRQVAVYGIVSCGITLIMLTGRTDLSAGMMFDVSGEYLLLLCHSGGTESGACNRTAAAHRLGRRTAQRDSGGRHST